MSKRLAQRLLIIGWDAADWKIIDTLFAHGGMPNLRSLVENGVRANLASLEPRLSPLLWSSIATGKTPDKHGILNFVEPQPSGEGIRIASSTSRKTKALWNILTQAGLRTNVVSWYATHPAEPIRGTVVSNLFYEGMPRSPEEPWPISTGAVHPIEMESRIDNDRVHPLELPLESVLPLIPNLKQEHLADHRVQMLVRNLAHCVSVHNVLTDILSKNDQWDCTMAFYETIDTVGHNFMQFHPPKMQHVSQADFDLFCEVMYGIYQFHDMMLGVLLNMAGPQTTVMLVSDHGFFSDHRRPTIQLDMLSVTERAAMEARWHAPLGILAMHGPGIIKGKKLYGARLLDIAPSALALLGLAVGSDMDGRALTESFDQPVELESVFSWDMVAGEAGQHPPELRQDPFEAQDAIKQLVDLGYMAALPESAREQIDMVARETQCNLATVYTTAGWPSKAVPIFESLVASWPDEARFRFGLARSLFADSQMEQCAKVVREFLAANPRHAGAQVILANALAASDRNAEALTVLQEMEKEHARNPDLAMGMADAYLRLGRWSDADRHFRNLIAADPESVFALHGLARAAIGLEQYEDAVEFCLEALERVHVFPDAHHTLGVALTWMNDYDHAIQSFNVALSMRPGMLDSHRYLATIYRHLKDGENAAKHRKIAEKLISEQGTGLVSTEFLKREAPMGPQEWAKRMGMAGDANANAAAE